MGGGYRYQSRPCEMRARGRRVCGRGEVATRRDSVRGGNDDAKYTPAIRRHNRLFGPRRSALRRHPVPKEPRPDVNPSGDGDGAGDARKDGGSDDGKHDDGDD